MSGAMCARFQSTKSPDEITRGKVLAKSGAVLREIGPITEEESRVLLDHLEAPAVNRLGQKVGQTRAVLRRA